MKKNLFTIMLLCGTFAAYAQSSVGLIAHWDMNGTTNDVSGNAHNGHGNNLTAAIGMDGIMGHAYYFNGVNSSITIPYSPSFNVNNYTIAATINVMGFYAGPCHNNTIFMRGKTSGGSTGGDWYNLVFTDLPAGYGCTPGIDSTLESFMPGAYSATNGMGPASVAVYNYTPHIVKNLWYTVVATFNDTVFNVYINDTLRTTGTITTPGVPIGSGIDSAYIGLDFMEVGTGYPYPFKGNIDDILLYNRALTDSEVVHLHDTCGSITLQPVRANVNSGGTATYTVHTSITGATFQWQQNSGTGFVNLSNAGAYSGVTTNTLTVTGVTAAMNNYLYRCLLSNSWGCSDTTSSALLTLGINNLVTNGLISVYPNPAHNELTITAQTITNVAIINLLGQTVYTHTYNTNKVQVNVANLPIGIYFVKINGSEVRKFMKE